MTAHYIPADDPSKLLWIVNFNQWLQANGASHGFSPAEIADMAVRAGDFNAAMVAHETAHAAAKAATQRKNTARAEAIALGRAFAQRVQTGPNTTDADRAAAGLTVPDTTPTRTSPDEIMTIDPPLLLLDFSARRQVTIHWGPNPANERNNGRPAGTGACQIQAARSGIPADDADWKDLGMDTESPHTHAVHDIQPTTYAYRARYVGKNYKYGPYSAPATCTVSV